MLRILLPVFAVLAACTSSPEDAAMRYPSPVSEAATRAPTGTSSDQHSGSLDPIGRGVVDHDQAAQGPIPAPVSAEENPAPNLPADSPAEARGRRTLSTAFVRVGPDGHLTVELRNGRVLVLRNVVMRAKDYCGVQALGRPGGTKYCGGYADIAAARPGGLADPIELGPAVSNPIKPGRSPSQRK